MVGKWLILALFFLIFASNHIQIAKSKLTISKSKILSAQYDVSKVKNFGENVESVGREKFGPESLKRQEEGKAMRNLLVCSMLYGSSYIAVKSLESHLGLDMTNCLRFGLASLYFLLRPKALLRKEAVVAGIELGFWCSLGFLAQAIALQLFSASKAAVFTSMTVVFSSLLEYFVMGDKFRSVKGFVGPFLAFIGAFVVEYTDESNPSIKDLVLLMVPACFSMCFFLAERHANQYPLLTEAMVGNMIIFTAVFFIIWSLVRGSFLSSLKSLPVLFSQPKLLSILLFTSFGTVYTALSEIKSLKIVSATRALVIYGTEPLFACLFSWLLLNEPVGWNMLVGAIFIILAPLIQNLIT